jgi:hypothetical protein
MDPAQICSPVLMSHEMSGTVQRIELFSRSHDAVIRVYDAAGNVIEMHEHAGKFKER